LRKVFRTLVTVLSLALFFFGLTSPSQTANAATTLSISTTSIPAATYEKAYTTTLKATGGTLPYDWKVVSGTHPTGFALDAGTGQYYGTPTKGGSYPLTFSVTDSSKPAQTKTVKLTVVVETPAFSITTTSFPAGTKGSKYSSTIKATGGTPSYLWSITSGKLPGGVTFAATTGVLSGTPTATGTFPLTFEVKDSSSPDLTKSASFSLVVAASNSTSSALTITSSALAAGTDDKAYSSQLKASGGTPSYTWSITSGKLPAGLTLAATTGVISGTPSTTGTSTFTATVKDSSNPDQTKSASTSIVIAVEPPQQSSSGTTWYIRTDGGTNTQCTGKTNAAYPGSGTAQECAFNHPYQMLDSSGAWAHMVGGDTIQFADSASTSHTYYMGEQNSGVGSDWSAQLSGICPAPNTGGGAGSSCILPAPPSGTSSQHTRILGQNAGNCHDSGHTHLVNPTVLSGINTAFTVLDTHGTEYVDISCIEITQPDTCTMVAGAGQCNDSKNYVKYGGIILSYMTEQGASNLTLQDVAVVGLAGNGILGSHLNKASSDVFSATDVYVIGNGEAGWNGDGGGCDTSCETVGTMNVSYATIDWNGCVAVKPYNMTESDTENAFNYCYGQSDGGYGDGFVQIAAGNMTLNVDHSHFRWNTQDGFDSLHLSDDVKTSPAIHISTSWSEGNAGQTFKLGAGAASSAINNVSISNCRILDNASAFPHNPSGWALDSADTCRAAGDEWAFQMNNGTVITLENNTSVGYGNVMYDIECAALAPNCAANGAKFIFRNNLSKGYPDPGNSNILASGIYLGAGNVLANSGSEIDHNLWNTMATGCPDSPIATEKIYTCGDPDLVGESNINAINPNLNASSPANGSGIAISGITTDFNGTTRPNPPAIGAMQP